MTAAVSIMAASDHVSRVVSPKAKAHAPALRLKNFASYLRRTHYELAFLLLVLTPAIYSKSTAELPRVYIDTSMPPQTASISVAAGGDLQAAIDNASCGTTIMLASGATFTGKFILPNKNCVGWIIIRTNTADSNLPPLGTRINPSYASMLAKVVTNNAAPVFQTDSGAHQYRLLGLNIGMTSGISDVKTGLIVIGNHESTLSDLPHDITIDRCYIHGDPLDSLRRGIAANGASVAVIDSYISEVHEADNGDTQAVWASNSPGPLKLVDNYLEAAGENVMFGGADPAIGNLVPSDIEFRRNHLFKRIEWRGTWPVKNLFELKNARRMLVEGNVMEYNWAPGHGLCIVLTPRNQNGRCPWCTVADVTFRYNIVRHVQGAFGIAGSDTEAGTSQPSQGIHIHDNLIEDINDVLYGGIGRCYQVVGGIKDPHDITIDHNDCFIENGNAALFVGEPGHSVNDFTFTNNISSYANYGIAGTNVAASRVLNTYFPDSVFSGNVIVAPIAGRFSSSDSPPGNYFPREWRQVSFVDRDGGDFRLSNRSPYKKAGTDGEDIGMNVTKLRAATAGVAF
jgi:hypothetical protein